MKATVKKCDTCDGAVSSRAKFCPHCGGRHYNGIQRLSFGHLFIAAALFAIAMAVLGAI